jgi:hypothetical protein
LQAGGSAGAATREALRYRYALLEGVAALRTRPLTTAIAVSVCTQIKAAEMRGRKVPATPPANSDTGEVVYTPPAGEARIRDLLANRERFLRLIRTRAALPQALGPTR